MSVTGNRITRLYRSVAVVAIGTVGALTVAACSSGSSTGTASTGATVSSAATVNSAAAACVASAKKFLAPYDSLPTTLAPGMTPLKAKPKPGGTVIKLVNGQNQGDVTSGKAMVAAAAAAGWTGKILIFDGSVADLNAKFTQAIAEKPTAIMLGGIPSAAVAQPLAQAAKDKIITEVTGSTDTPNSTGGYEAVTSSAATFQLHGKVNAYLALRDSGCSNTYFLVANIPAYPVLAAEAKAFTDVITSQCPSCKVVQVNLQASDLGSAAATTDVVSAIQADPQIKYVYATLGNIADGLPAALSAAGITGVKIFGDVPDPQSILGLQNKTEAWWLASDSTVTGWGELDSVFRVIETGQPVTNNPLPIGVLTPENVSPGATQPSTPSNYEALFEKLWGLG
jgi:ribose transport system substrate-binding protein